MFKTYKVRSVFVRGPRDEIETNSNQYNKLISEWTTLKVFFLAFRPPFSAHAHWEKGLNKFSELCDY